MNQYIHRSAQNLKYCYRKMLPSFENFENIFCLLGNLNKLTVYSVLEWYLLPENYFHRYPILNTSNFKDIMWYTRKLVENSTILQIGYTNYSVLTLAWRAAKNEVVET